MKGTRKYEYCKYTIRFIHHPTLLVLEHAVASWALLTH